MRSVGVPYGGYVGVGVIRGCAIWKILRSVGVPYGGYVGVGVPYVRGKQSYK